MDYHKSRKIENSKAFMPVHLQKLRACEHGVFYSMTHYYEQNGDLMRDPDMEFIVTDSGQV